MAFLEKSAGKTAEREVDVVLANRYKKEQILGGDFDGKRTQTHDARTSPFCPFDWLEHLNGMPSADFLKHKRRNLSREVLQLNSHANGVISCHVYGVTDE